MRTWPYVFALWFAHTAVIYLIVAMRLGNAPALSMLLSSTVLSAPMTILSFIMLYFWVRLERVYFITPETKFEVVEEQNKKSAP